MQIAKVIYGASETTNVNVDGTILTVAELRSEMSVFRIPTAAVAYVNGTGPKAENVRLADGDSVEYRKKRGSKG